MNYKTIIGNNQIQCDLLRYVLIYLDCDAIATSTDVTWCDPTVDIALDDLYIITSIHLDDASGGTFTVSTSNNGVDYNTDTVDVCIQAESLFI